jgi:hypothetical protein
MKNATYSKMTLNEALAKKFKVMPLTYIHFAIPAPPIQPLKPLQVLLIDDTQRLMELAIKHNVLPTLYWIGMMECYQYINTIVKISDCESRISAYRRTIGLALMRLNKEGRYE